MTGYGTETGDIILSWLLRLVVTIAVLALVVFEVVTVVLASVRADDAAGEVARAAAVAYGSSGSLERAGEAAAQVADERDVRLDLLEQDGATVVVEVSAEAGTILLHRFPGTEELRTRTATRRVDVGD